MDAGQVVVVPRNAPGELDLTSSRQQSWAASVSEPVSRHSMQDLILHFNLCCRAGDVRLYVQIELWRGTSPTR